MISSAGAGPKEARRLCDRLVYAAPGSGTEPVQILIQRLAVAGFGVYSTGWQDRHELTILNVAAARSCLTFTDNGLARWHYEPATGPATDVATLAAIIVHILGTPHTGGGIPGVTAYRAFPLKGKVGRCLQDRGLTVTLRVCEDWESFEATTDIEITSPAWLGTVRLADNGHLDWECDYRAAFHGDPGSLADVIAPILRAGPGSRPRSIPSTPG